MRPRQRFPAWQDSISALFDIRHDPISTKDDFDATLTSYLLDEQVMFCRCETKAQQFERNPLRAAYDGLDHYLIQTHVEGSQDVRRGEKIHRCSPGDLLIIDLADAHAAETTDFRHLTLVVPRHLLAPLLRNPDNQEGRVLRGDAPLTSLAVSHLRAIEQVVDRLSPEEAAMTIQPSLALMASALNGSADEVDGGAPGVAMSVLLRAKAEIERGLHDPQLSVGRLCNALQLSRAGLYRLFEPHGGVRNYIQERRLRRSAEELFSPLHAQRRIYDIAFAWGFTSEAHFSRAFKRRYGLAPRDARQARQPLPRPAAAPSGSRRFADRSYELWLHETLKG